MSEATGEWLVVILLAILWVLVWCYYRLKTLVRQAGFVCEAIITYERRIDAREQWANVNAWEPPPTTDPFPDST